MNLSEGGIHLFFITIIQIKQKNVLKSLSPENPLDCRIPCNPYPLSSLNILKWNWRLWDWKRERRSSRRRTNDEHVAKLFCHWKKWFTFQIWFLLACWLHLCHAVLSGPHRAIHHCAWWWHQGITTHSAHPGATHTTDNHNSNPLCWGCLKAWLSHMVKVHFFASLYWTPLIFLLCCTV